MQRFRHFRPSPTLVIACLALLVALGGTSIAAVTALPPNSVGTVQLKNGAVTAAKLRDSSVDSAKVRDGALLAADFAPGELPAPGAPGPAGPQGPKGDPATSLWAVVRPAPGAIMVRWSGATSLTTTAFGKGAYVVTFNRDVSTCAWVATVGNSSSVGLQPGYAVVSPAPSNTNGVLVGTFDLSGALTDFPFHVAVFC